MIDYTTLTSQQIKDLSVKERMLLYIDTHNERRLVFYHKMKSSSANFTGANAKTDTTCGMLRAFRELYPLSSIEWLLYGNGTMDARLEDSYYTISQIYEHRLSEKDQLIATLREQHQMDVEHISELRELLSIYRQKK